MSLYMHVERERERATMITRHKLELVKICTLVQEIFVWHVLP